MKILKICLIVLFVIILVRLIIRKYIDFPNYSGVLFENQVEIDSLMPEDDFWYLIEKTKKESKGNYDLQCELLTNYLSEKTANEIILFDRTFNMLMAKSYKYNLWEAAYALNGGCSDDCFEFFRTWLIAQGKNKFYRTVHNPRLLFFFGVKELIQNYEGAFFCAKDAYRSKTAMDLYTYNDINYDDPGNIFNEELAFLKYPELAILAW